jgi:hypothetical protein
MRQKNEVSKLLAFWLVLLLLSCNSVKVANPKSEDQTLVATKDANGGATMVMPHGQAIAFLEKAYLSAQGFPAVISVTEIVLSEDGKYYLQGKGEFEGNSKAIRVELHEVSGGGLIYKEVIEVKMCETSASCQECVFSKSGNGCDCTKSKSVVNLEMAECKYTTIRITIGATAK